MGEVGVRELREGLSRHLARVREGAALTVTDHGHPIARLVPFERRSALEELIAAGLVLPPVQAKRPAPDPIEVAGSISDLIADQRG